MANIYVYSGGSNTSPYDTWAKAATTLVSGLGAAVAGDDIWIASDHAESTASAISPAFPGTAAAPNRCMSVSRAGSTPPVAADLVAGAAITTTGASGIGLSGFFYMWGVTLNCGTTSGAANITLAGTSQKSIFESCTFKCLSTSTGSRVQVANTQAWAVLINCTVQFSNASQCLVMTGRLDWYNKPGSTAIVSGTLPTTLVLTSTTSTSLSEWSGLDLSALASGKTIWPAHTGGLTLQNCKLDAAVTVATVPAVGMSLGLDLIGCGSTANVARNERWRFPGTLTTETTIVRTAGASDGTTPFSWKIVTNADADNIVNQFETFEGVLWNAVTGASKTLTVHTVTDNVTLTDAEIYLEVEYLGSSATPVTSLISDEAATKLTAGSNQASDSGEAWTTTGLTTPVKQKLEVTFTPQMAGPIRWRVKVAKASTTVYICPKADLS